MTHRWNKLGQVYAPGSSGRHSKLVSHAANPLPIHLEDDVYRIFYSGRDKENRSSVGAVDIDILQRKVVAEHYHPFFQHGPEGCYYADGVSIGNCYLENGVRYMLFMGWQNPRNGHWRGDIGRLKVNRDLTLELDGDAPYMGVDTTDPISLSYPWVFQNGEDDYLMWYGSTMTWDAGNGEMIHVINHASSLDGHTWVRHGLAVPYKTGVAQAFSRPTVTKNTRGGFDMWFSYRSGSGDRYRIGYARSADGKAWTLDLNNAGIAVAPHGWDSEMIEYPFVLEHKGLKYMLYNGNGYGKTGFGLAVLSE
jgi:hypothetical protein